jgi:transcriptional regulator with XRE-family HTH domain
VTITARQIRAARALLGWSQPQLADHSRVAQATIARLERAAVVPRIDTLNAVREALEAGGVEFLPESGGRGDGVRLKQPATEGDWPSSRTRSR